MAGLLSRGDVRLLRAHSIYPGFLPCTRHCRRRCALLAADARTVGLSRAIGCWGILVGGGARPSHSSRRRLDQDPGSKANLGGNVGAEWEPSSGIVCDTT